MFLTEATQAELIATERLPVDFRGQIERLWGPLADRIRTRRAERGGMLVVGLCGPQGSGKTTGARTLALILREAGLRTTILSLDDLYLGHAERQRLAARVHPLLATRGPPGTHEVDLGCAVLDALTEPGEVRLPRFDKAKDDRIAPAQAIVAPFDVVLFEGWCVGARAQTPEALADPINTLEAEEDPDGVWRRYVNDALTEHYPALFDRIGLLIQLRAPSFETVLGWRLEQEHKLRKRTGGGMSDAEVRRFIQFYERLSRHIDTEMPARADVVIQLDPTRRPVATS